MSTHGRFTGTMQSPSVWLDDRERAAWWAYRQLHNVLDPQITRDLAADSGLSDADYHVLSTLSDEPDEDWRLGGLAERLGWSRSRLAHQLRRMQQRDLVVRHDSGEDPRGGRIGLSAAGRRVIETAAPTHVESVRRHFVDRLTPEQMESLVQISAAIVRPLQAGRSAAREGEGAAYFQGD